MGRKTTVKKLWDQIDELKVLLSRNPSIPIEEYRRVVGDMEWGVKALRKRELRRRWTKEKLKK